MFLPREFAILDVETLTNMVNLQRMPEVVEIGAIMYNSQFKELSVFEEVVCPKTVDELSDSAVNNGLDPAYIKTNGCMDVLGTLNRLAAFLRFRKTPLLAWRAHFDYACLNQTMADVQYHWNLNSGIIDVRSMFVAHCIRKGLSVETARSLTSARQYLGLPPVTHRAVEDCRALVPIIRTMFDEPTNDEGFKLVEV